MKIVTYDDSTGLAPADMRWIAVDDDTYDGAPDSSTRAQIGYGRTEQEARDDLRRLLEECAASKSESAP